MSSGGVLEKYFCISPDLQYTINIRQEILDWLSKRLPLEGKACRILRHFKATVYQKRTV